MKPTFQALCLSVLVLSSIGSAPAHADEVSGEPAGQVIRFYSDGALFQPLSLPANGTGFVHLFGERNRFWGSSGMIAFLQDISRDMKQLFPTTERLQMGDLSAQVGGQVGGHVSHQNGLDVDVVYYRVNHQEQSQETPGSTGFSEDFVLKGKISSNFDTARNWALVKRMFATQRIERIFMDIVIKNTLCQHAKDIGEYDQYVPVLRRLRHVENHKNHLHARFTCPQDSSECVPQKDNIPEGSGCFASLSTIQSLPPLEGEEE